MLNIRGGRHEVVEVVKKRVGTGTIVGRLSCTKPNPSSKYLLYVGGDGQPGLEGQHHSWDLDSNTDQIRCIGSANGTGEKPGPRDDDQGESEILGEGKLL